MDSPNNSGLIVVNFDGCIPTTAQINEDVTIESDCLYTVPVTVSAPEMPISTTTSCLQPTNCELETTDLNSRVQQIDRKQIIDTLDDNYYNLLLGYLTSQNLPENLSEAQRTMITRRSRHYQVIKGELFHGQTHPKKVIVDQTTRATLMDDIHIDRETGVHLGVQKMHFQLKKEYFWCGMYADLANYVRRCKQCIDADLPQFMKIYANKSKNRNPDSDSDNFHDSASSNATCDVSEIWRKVEFRLSGPFTHDKFILSIADPHSSWVDAIVVEPPDLSTQAANYLLNTFYQLGFAPFTTIGFTAELLTDLQQQYKQRLIDLISTQRCSESTMEKLTDCTDHSILCPWIEEIFMALVKEYPNSWPDQIFQRLFEFRCRNDTHNRTSPFRLMFQRDPIPVFIEENKENLALRRFSKRLQNSQMKSNTNLESRHAYSRKRTTRKKTVKCTKVVDETVGFSNSDEEPNAVDVSLHTDSSQEHPAVCEARANTVAAVQALLSATREERSRRGQYQRFTAEQQDDMARYSIEHGSLTAVKHFSEKLGTVISESTIRNFVKTYQTYSPEIQVEIGAFAMTNSVQLATQHFTAKLGFEVRPSIVRKFRKRYAAKYATDITNTNDAKIEESQASKPTKKNKLFDAKTKEEIGQFAHQHGIPMTVEHFSLKLQSPVKETVVRKLKKLFEEKQKQQTIVLPEHQVSSNTPTMQTETMDVVQTSYSVINCNPSSQTLIYNQQPTYQQLIPPVSFHPNNSALDHSVIYQQQSMASVISANSTLVFSPASFHTTTSYSGTFSQLSTTSPNVHLPGTSSEPQEMLTSAEPINERCNASQMILSQHPILITQSNGHDCNMTMHLDAMPAIPSFQTQVTNQSDATSAMNFLQPSAISYAPTSVSSGGEVFQQEVSSNPSTSFSPTTVINSNPSQVIHVVKMGCDNSTVVNVIPEQTDNESVRTKCSEEVASIKLPRKSNKVKKKTSKGKSSVKATHKSRGLGTYTTYSPEIRAEIGRYAATHGNLQTVIHFRDILGHDIPESTVRGLKGKYLTKKQLCSENATEKGNEVVTCLGFAPRGRPIRLGKYDEMIRQCIQALVNNGERVSSFLAIATAKQVLMEHDPSLLAENGGNIKLTSNWAKSFLKRIGIHNNS